MEHWCVAVDKVRYVGEPVAVVIAESRYLAEDAIEGVCGECGRSAVPGTYLKPRLHLHPQLPHSAGFETFLTKIICCAEVIQVAGPVHVSGEQA